MKVREIENVGRRTLSTLIFVLMLMLGIVLLSSERGVSGVIQDLGNFISRFFS